MSRRALVLAALMLLLVAGCSSGPAAPPIGDTTRVCTDTFCLDIPDGWNGEVTDSFVALHHDLAPDGTFLTANTVDMEAIVQASGGTWPVPPDDVVHAFWHLLDVAGEGELQRTERQIGGAIRSWGSHSTGDMWYLLVPVEGTVAIGVEMRAPNDTWESHVDAVFASVEAMPGSSEAAP